MKININEMSLRQILNAIQRLQTWLDEALQERVESMEDLGPNRELNGDFMALLWREDALRELLTALREGACERFDGEGRRDAVVPTGKPGDCP